MNVAEIDRELDAARRDGPVRDIAIPPCPELLVALQDEMRQRDPDPDVISRIAGSDVAMAAALIRTSNSSLYARSRQARTVAEAMSMLGLGQTVGILTGFLTRHAIPVSPSLVEHFWETSTCRSLAMAHIARQLYDVDVDIAQTCGLFMHVGIPILLQGVRGYAGTLAEALARKDRGFTDTENAVHRTDHAVIGAIVAKTWRLAPEIALVVRLHHDFSILHDSQIPVEVRHLVAIAAIAEHLVASFEGVKEQREWSQHGPACMALIHVSENELEPWADALHPVFENVSLV